MLPRRPDLISFNGALSAARVAGQSDVTLRLLSRMRDCAIMPNHASFGAAVSACRRTGDGSTAVSLVETMLSEGLSPSEPLLVDALGACAKSGLHDAAQQLWNQILAAAASNSRPPGVRAFDARLHERGTAMDWMVRTECHLESMLTKSSSLPSSLRHLSCPFLWICGMGMLAVWREHLTTLGVCRAQGAIGLLEDMKQKGVSIEESTCNYAARACGRAGAAGAAVQLLDDSLIKYGVSPTVRSAKSPSQLLMSIA